MIVYTVVLVLILICMIIILIKDFEGLKDINDQLDYNKHHGYDYATYLVNHKYEIVTSIIIIFFIISCTVSLLIHNVIVGFS